MTIPIHPIYGHPQSGVPKVEGDTTFRPYRTGIGRSAWISDDFRILIYSPPFTASYSVSVDGVYLPKRFRLLRRAMAAGIKHCGASP